MVSLLDSVLTSLPDAVIFDIDGTLSDPTDRFQLLDGLADADQAKTAVVWEAFHRAGKDDFPYDYMFQLMAVLSMFRFRIVLCTGKPDNHRKATVEWLSAHTSVHYDALLMRTPGDHRPDTVVKAEMLDKIRNELKLNPVMAFDDREAVAQMFQEHGVPCLVHKPAMLKKVETKAEEDIKDDEPVTDGEVETSCSASSELGE